MKVPIRYKSSDRYNAGVDVVYDDESKLQYAPFIYAGTQSGDNGTDDGGDEEGEDIMVVHIKENDALDKNWEEILGAMKTGMVVINSVDTDEEVTQSIVVSCYIDETTNKYTVYCMHASGVGDVSTPTYISDTSTGELMMD